MYPGNLSLFHDKKLPYVNQPYREYLNSIISETTEFAGAYIKALNQSGIETGCLIANDELSFRKWRHERGKKTAGKNEFFLEEIRQYNPDVLWIENLSVTDVGFLQLVRKTIKNVKLIICFHCSPFGPKILERLPYVDFIITCTPGLKDFLESNGHRAYHVYHGFDTSVLAGINMVNQTYGEDIVFSGSLATGPGFHKERIRLIENMLNAGLNLSLYVNTEQQYRIRIKQFLNMVYKSLKFLHLLKLTDYFPFLHYGKEKVENYPDLVLRKKHDPVFGTRMYNLFANSKIVMNNHLGATGEYAGNMRLFEATGVGSCLLTDNKQNISDLFIPGKEIIVYDNINDCIEKAWWLLENESERKRIAQAGQEKTLSEHTVNKRCQQICEIISTELEAM